MHAAQMGESFVGFRLSGQTWVRIFNADNISCSRKSFCSHHSSVTNTSRSAFSKHESCSSCEPHFDFHLNFSHLFSFGLYQTHAIQSPALFSETMLKASKGRI